MTDDFNDSYIDASAVFLAVLAEGASVGVAARAAGVSASTAYQWRSRYPDFAEEWRYARLPQREPRSDADLGARLGGGSLPWSDDDA